MIKMQIDDKGLVKSRGNIIICLAHVIISHVFYNITAVGVLKCSSLTSLKKCSLIIQILFLIELLDICGIVDGITAIYTLFCFPS